MLKAKKFLFGFIFLILAVSFLFSKVEYTFYCDKAISLCKYSTSTFINHKHTIENIYKLDDFKFVDYTEYKTTTRSRRGGTKVKTHYEATIFTNDGTAIVFPVKFNNAEAALAEVDNLNSYLTNGMQYYKYTKNNGYTSIVILVLLFGFLGIYYLRGAVKKNEAAPKGGTEEKKEKSVERRD